MSFLDDIISVGGGLLGNLFGGNSLGGTLAKAAITGFALNQISKSINQDNQKAQTANEPTPDFGVRLQVEPDTTHKIPIVYGTALLGGIITDARLSADNKTMSYCITICEKTGPHFETGQPSTFLFKDIYWNGQRLVFKSDGITVSYGLGRNGEIDRSLDGLVRVYCYAGNSSTPASKENYSSSFGPAYTIMPEWTVDYQMNDLIFAIIQVDYNKDKNVQGLGDMTFQIKNSLTEPGDCLYDYMTNTRYGAGIKPEDIYSA